MNSSRLANLSKIGQLKAEAPDANERAFVHELIDQVAALIDAVQKLP